MSCRGGCSHPPAAFSLLSLQRLLFDVKRPKSRILRGAAKLLLDAEKLVVLGDALAAAGGAGLDLAGVQRNGQVGNRGVLGLAGAVGRNGGVTGLVRHLDGLQRLGNRADLVQLDEDRVAAAQANALGQALGVRDEQIVADQLDLAAQLLRQCCQPSQSSSSRPSSME